MDGGGFMAGQTDGRSGRHSFNSEPHRQVSETQVLVQVTTANALKQSADEARLVWQATHAPTQAYVRKRADLPF